MKIKKSLAVGALTLAMSVGTVLTSHASSEVHLGESEYFDYYMTQENNTITGHVKAKTDTVDGSDIKFVVNALDKDVEVEEIANNTFALKIAKEENDTTGGNKTNDNGSNTTLTPTNNTTNNNNTTTNKTTPTGQVVSNQKTTKAENQDAGGNPKTGIASMTTIAVIALTGTGAMIFTKKGKNSKTALALALTVLASSALAPISHADEVDVNRVFDVFGPVEVTAYAYNENTGDLQEVQIEIKAQGEVKIIEDGLEDNHTDKDPDSNTTEDPNNDDSEPIDIDKLDDLTEDEKLRLKTIDFIRKAPYVKQETKDHYIKEVMETSANKNFTLAEMLEALEDQIVWISTSNRDHYVYDMKEYIRNSSVSQEIKDKYISLIDQTTDLDYIDSLFLEFMDIVESGTPNNNTTEKPNKK